MCIGLGALTFNYTFPLKIVEPPYNWSQVIHFHGKIDRTLISIGQLGSHRN